jgi:hypothetical protein
MSKTYRNNSDGNRCSDGGRHYSSPRYRPGTRQKPHQIVAIPKRHAKPDLDALTRAIARAALEQASRRSDDKGSADA